MSRLALAGRHPFATLAGLSHLVQLASATPGNDVEALRTAGHDAVETVSERDPDTGSNIDPWTLVGTDEAKRRE